MAEGVRRHPATVDAHPIDPPGQASTHVGGRQTTTRSGDEERPAIGLGHDPRAPSLEPRDGGEQRGLTDRDGTCLVAFAVHAKRFPVGVDVAHVELHEFLGAQPTAVRQLEHRAIAEAEWAGTAGRVEEAACVGRGKHPRQVVAAFGRSETLRRARLDEAVLAERPEERADRGDAAGDGRWRQPSLGERREVAAQVRQRGGLGREIARCRPDGEVGEVGGVGAARSSGEATAGEVTVEKDARRLPGGGRRASVARVAGVGDFYIHVHDGTIATLTQLAESEVIEPGDDPELPWHRINAQSDATTLWFVAMRRQEKGIWLGTLTIRHGDHHSLLVSQGWEEVPVDDIGVPDA